MNGLVVFPVFGLFVDDILRAGSIIACICSLLLPTSTIRLDCFLLFPSNPTPLYATAPGGRMRKGGRCWINWIGSFNDCIPRRFLGIRQRKDLFLYWKFFIPATSAVRGERQTRNWVWIWEGVRAKGGAVAIKLTSLDHIELHRWIVCCCRCFEITTII